MPQLVPHRAVLVPRPQQLQLVLRVLAPVLQLRQLLLPAGRPRQLQLRLQAPVLGPQLVQLLQQLPLLPLQLGQLALLSLSEISGVKTWLKLLRVPIINSLEPATHLRDDFTITE